MVVGASDARGVSALDTSADRLQTEPQSLEHANVVRAAFASAAQLLQNAQRRSFPIASAQVGLVRKAADIVSKERPPLEHCAEVNRFFMSAADNVRAMSGGACSQRRRYRLDAGRRRRSHLSLERERMRAEINAGGQAKAPGSTADAHMETGCIAKLVLLEDLDDYKIASGDPDPSFFRQRRAGRDDVPYVGIRERRY